MHDVEVENMLILRGYQKSKLTNKNIALYKDNGNGIIYWYLWGENHIGEDFIFTCSFKLLQSSKDYLTSVIYNIKLTTNPKMYWENLKLKTDDFDKPNIYKVENVLNLLEKFFSDLQTSFNTFYDAIFPDYIYSYEIGYFTFGLLGLDIGDKRWREIAELFLEKSEVYAEDRVTKPRRDCLKKCLSNPSEYKRYIQELHLEIQKINNGGITTKTKKDVLAKIENIPTDLKDRIKELLKEYVSSKDFTELYKSIEDQRDKLGRIKGDLTVYNIDQIRNIIEVLYMLNEDEDLDVDKLRNKWGMEIFEDDDELADAIGYGDLE